MKAGHLRKAQMRIEKLQQTLNRTPNDPEEIPTLNRPKLFPSDEVDYSREIMECWSIVVCLLVPSIRLSNEGKTIKSHEIHSVILYSMLQ